MTTGDRIRNRRIELGLTQTELAKRAGFNSRSGLNKIEADTRPVTNKHLKQLADALQTTPEYIMGWDDKSSDQLTLGVNREPDCYQYAVLGDIAAGYEYPAVESWDGEIISIPSDYITRPPTDYFVLQVKGSSMYPQYIEGDKVLMLKQNVLDYSGQVCAILYANEYATLKRVEYTQGQNWLRMIPINPEYEPRTIWGNELELCHILGIPKVVVRTVKQ